MSSPAEEWRSVVGYEGAYEVSNLGRIRSLDRYSPRTSKSGSAYRVRIKGKVLALGPHTGGYRCAQLYLEGVLRATLLHIVVAEAFHGPKPFPKAEVRHLDGKKDNCGAANLVWGTRLENEADKLAHGTRVRGEASGRSKLKAADVLAIRARAGERQQDLADEFGVTFSNISAIQLRKSWQHV